MTLEILNPWVSFFFLFKHYLDNRSLILNFKGSKTGIFLFPKSSVSVRKIPSIRSKNTNSLWHAKVQNWPPPTSKQTQVSSKGCKCFLFCKLLPVILLLPRLHLSADYSNKCNRWVSTTVSATQNWQLSI